MQVLERRGHVKIGQLAEERAFMNDTRPDVPYSPAHAPSQPRLLDRVRTAIRLRRYSRRTEQAYVAWIRRFTVSKR